MSDTFQIQLEPHGASFACTPAQTVLDAAIAATGHPAAALRYLPLTSSKTREWVALLDAQMRIVGYAPVDGF